jgi:hypothetical protein
MEWRKLCDRYPNLPRELKPFQVIYTRVIK